LGCSAPGIKSKKPHLPRLIANTHVEIDSGRFGKQKKIFSTDSSAASLCPARLDSSSSLLHKPYHATSPRWRHRGSTRRLEPFGLFSFASAWMARWLIILYVHTPDILQHMNCCLLYWLFLQMVLFDGASDIKVARCWLRFAALSLWLAKKVALYINKRIFLIKNYHPLCIHPCRIRSIDPFAPKQR
jgi:hypothetical protein